MPRPLRASRLGNSSLGHALKSGRRCRWFGVRGRHSLRGFVTHFAGTFVSSAGVDWIAAVLVIAGAFVAAGALVVVTGAGTAGPLIGVSKSGASARRLNKYATSA